MSTLAFEEDPVWRKLNAVLRQALQQERNTAEEVEKIVVAELVASGMASRLCTVRVEYKGNDVYRCRALDSNGADHFEFDFELTVMSIEDQD